MSLSLSLSHAVVIFVRHVFLTPSSHPNRYSRLRSQGDLKPQNCFIDDAGIVKVGDFGLSRSNVSPSDGTLEDEAEAGPSPPSADVDPENTAGVGTRAYSSPEQIEGSNYDASTDIYSLGIILFELLYPMYTSMERYKEFAAIRKRSFPPYWTNNVQRAFPSLHLVLLAMLSHDASERPSAASVHDHVEGLLGEYTIQSLDRSWAKGNEALLLRVEADETDGVLPTAIRLIKEAAGSDVILQYGLRGKADKAIMEFALRIPTNPHVDVVEEVTAILAEHDMSVRRITTLV